MKSKVLGFFVPLFLIAVAAAVLLAYNPVHHDSLLLIKDIKTGKAIRYYKTGTLFTPESLVPWKYSIEVMNLHVVETTELEIPISQFKTIQDDLFDIVIPIRVTMSINPDITGPELLAGNAGELKKRVYRDLKRSIQISLDKYFRPLYAPDEMVSNIKDVIRTAVTSYNAGAVNTGAGIVSVDVIGLISYPDEDMYMMAVRHIKDLTGLRMSNEKELLKIKHDIQRDNLKKEELYSHYRKMSVIIENHPEILKYIYIDKISDDISVIISSDKSGIPMFMDSAGKILKAAQPENSTENGSNPKKNKQ